MSIATPDRITIRLSAEEQAAVMSLAGRIAAPLRRAPTISDAARAAILYAAKHMPQATKAA